MEKSYSHSDFEEEGEMIDTPRYKYKFMPAIVLNGHLVERKHIGPYQSGHDSIKWQCYYCDKGSEMQKTPEESMYRLGYFLENRCESIPSHREES